MVTFECESPGALCQTSFLIPTWLKSRHKATARVREEEWRKAWPEMFLCLLSHFTAMAPPCAFQKCHHLLTGAPAYLTQPRLGEQHCGFKLQESYVSLNGQVPLLQMSPSEWCGLFWPTAL